VRDIALAALLFFLWWSWKIIIIALAAPVLLSFNLGVSNIHIVLERNVEQEVKCNIMRAMILIPVESCKPHATVAIFGLPT
jgi:hypothetical protein